jgi:hypothetical protein
VISVADTDHDRRADLVRDTKVFVEHEVSFHLAPADRFVVPRRHAQGYVSVGYVTVVLHVQDERVWVHAHGSVCKKDGTPSAVTSMNESVDLPDEAVWVERARRVVAGGRHMQEPGGPVSDHHHQIGAEHE